MGKYSGFAESEGSAWIRAPHDSMYYDFSITFSTYSNEGVVLLDGDLTCRSRAFSYGPGEGGTSAVVIGSGVWRTLWLEVDGPVGFQGDYKGTMTFLNLRMAVNSRLYMVDPFGERPSYFYDSGKVEVESGNTTFTFRPYYD